MDLTGKQSGGRRNKVIVLNGVANFIEKEKYG
jgi:hypothetical protein